MKLLNAELICDLQEPLIFSDDNFLQLYLLIAKVVTVNKVT